MSNLEAPAPLTTIDVAGLCTTGTEAQQAAFVPIDTMPWYDGRKIEVDNAKVMSAHTVCQSCVLLDDCNKMTEEWSDDASVALPRQFTSIAVIGNNLVVNSTTERSIQEIDSTAIPVDVQKDPQDFHERMFDTLMHRSYDKSALYNLGDGLEGEMYIAAVHGDIDEGFLEELRGVLMNPRLRGAAVAQFNKALKAVMDRPDYGKNHKQGGRFLQFSQALTSDNFNGGIFSELPPLNSGNAQKSEIVKANKEILKEDTKTYINEGLCQSGVGPFLFSSAARKDAVQAQNLCLDCPVFVECGVTSIFESVRNVKGVRTATSLVTRRDMRTRIGNYRLEAALERTDFPQIREVVGSLYAKYQRELQPKMLRGPDTTEEDLKARVGVEDAFVAGVDSALAAFGIHKKGMASQEGEEVLTERQKEAREIASVIVARIKASSDREVSPEEK